MSDHDDIRDALHRVTPELSVPDGLLAGARRRRQRTRGMAAGGAVAAVAVLVAPFALNLGGNFTLEAGPASAPDSDMAAAHEEAAQPAPVAGATEPGAVPDDGSSDGPAAEEALPASDLAAAASQSLGWEVIQASDGVNRVVSPSSLSMSLAQTAEGAEGESLDSIDAMLGLSGDARSEAFAALRESLLKYDSLPASVDADDPPETPVVHQASRILAIDAEIKQPYLDRISRFYDATSESTTLPEAKANLDAWVEKHTAGLIEESAIEPNSDTVAVLQDAVLFAASWETPFQWDSTIPFQAPSGTKDVPAMSQALDVSYAEGDRWTAVRLPYSDQLAADVILPREGVSPTDLTTEELEEAEEALAATVPDSVQVTMPTFDLAVTSNLREALPQIDLSNLNGIYSGASAGAWMQQAKLIVSARGTVGAAVTEMEVVVSGRVEPSRTFHVDRPYVFRVLDTDTSWPLFLAAISDPSEAS